jgi:cell wall-associated protease
MVLRAIPNGDEHDKDVYHAIHYAVDQGARIINMSFGKGFSPHQDKVREALQYAHDHAVLLVHSAGNSAEDLDQVASYPARDAKEEGGYNDAWIEVGAVAKGGRSPIASFSNYGKHSVDLFAPGVNILSTVPSNRYESYSGTSMAAPVVTGTAALMLSAFPGLTAQELRRAILETVRTQDSKQQSLNLQEKSSSAGVIDAYSLYKKLEVRQR